MIETARCQLFRIQDDDYQDVAQLYTDKQVRKYLGGPVDEGALRKKFINMTQDDRAFYWVVKNKRTGEFIGQVSLDQYHDQVSTEVSYQFLPKTWGKGYATEVIKGIIAFSFDELSLDRLVAETQSANRASCKLLEKLGMRVVQIVERFGAEQKVYILEKGK